MKFSLLFFRSVIVAALILSLSVPANTQTNFQKHKPALSRVRSRIVQPLRSLGFYPYRPENPLEFPLSGSFFYKHSDQYKNINLPVTKYVVINSRQKLGKWVSAGNRQSKAKVNLIQIRLVQLERHRSAKEIAAEYNKRSSGRKESSTSYEVRGGGQIIITKNYYNLTAFAKDKVYSGLSGDMYLILQKGTTTSHTGWREGGRPYRVIKRGNRNGGYLSFMWPNGFFNPYQINRPQQMRAFAEYHNDNTNVHFGIEVITSLPRTITSLEIAVPDEKVIDKVMRIIARNIQEELGTGKSAHVKLSDCFKKGEQTRYINALQSHHNKLSQIDKEMDAALNGPEPNKSTLTKIGKKVYNICFSYSKIINSYIRGETRHGLYKEVMLIKNNSLLAHQISVKYRKLANVPDKPVDQNELDEINRSMSGSIMKLLKKQAAARLENEGLREILNSESWDEVVSKTAEYAGSKVKNYLKRETRKIFGLGFYNAKSAKRALRLQMRREVRRQIGKLFVKVTSNQLIINFVVSPVIRWLREKLWPKLREALRPKGDLKNRTDRSIGTLRRARNELNKLTCDTRLNNVRQAMARARGAVLATKYLDRDIRKANDAKLLTRLADGKGNLSRTISMTAKRFLLDKKDYSEKLSDVKELLQITLDDIKKAIPDKGEESRKDPGETDKRESKKLLLKGFDYKKNKKYHKALDLFKKSAELGNHAAMGNIGYLYERGQGVNKNYGEAFKWYKKSADLGNSYSMTKLGTMYERRGIEQNYSKAANWYKLAAEKGNAKAQSNLAHLYQTGKGVVKDQKKAVSLMKLAAGQGNVRAEAQLGYMYEFGKGVEKDHREAARWYKLGAEHGDIYAQVNLALAYYAGRGVRKDMIKAAEWFKVSADRGHTKALYKLAWMYDNGQGGLAKDPNEAIRLYRIAARKGHKNSQDKLKKKNMGW